MTEKILINVISCQDLQKIDDNAAEDAWVEAMKACSDFHLNLTRGNLKHQPRT